MVIVERLTACVARLHNNVARLYLVDGTNVQHQIHQHSTAQRIMVHGHDHLVLNNHKQQSMWGTAEAASGNV